MNPSNSHNNWITVGEIINLIKKPVASYTSQVVEKWHAKLRKDCLPFGRCTSPEDCQTKKKSDDLCLCCKGWYKELAKSHQNTKERQINWRQNCNTSKWPDDSWEVAKFFMRSLGYNKGTVKDAESSDLSSLLNVLEWMKDIAFAPDKRVDRVLVMKLRSEVRNPWAHAPNQEMVNADKIKAFDIAIKFLVDLDKVFSCDEVKKCTSDIQFVQDNGISNVVEAELNSLRLLGQDIGADVSRVKEEIKILKEDQSSNRQDIEENKRKLKMFGNRFEECMTRIEDDNFQSKLSEIRADFKSKLSKICADVKSELSGIRADLKSLQDVVNVPGTDRRFQLKSCIPDKLRTFIGRGTEMKQIISSLVENGCGIVSIVGGPGFGKSTVAVEVSHRLNEKHDIVVFFSWLSTASTVLDVIPCLCRDVGVDPGEDPKSSLMLWLKNIEKKVVLVMDNIEQLLENDATLFIKLVRTLRKDSHQQLQILTTTRTKFSIPDQTTEDVQIGELDAKSSVKLLRKYCHNEEVEDGYLSELANLCGHVPLALCIAGSRIPYLDDHSELIQWLKVMPMKALRTPDQCVEKTIEFSFHRLSDEDKEALVRLSVFDGNFQKNSAGEVIERTGLETLNFLEKMVARSLIENSSDKRFLIHSLIRRFLAGHHQFRDKRAIAQSLMVKHFLKVCHLLTMDSYRKDRFTGARESLKKDAHNIEKTLKVCSQGPATNLDPNIVDILASSDIYKSSSRFFYNFSWDLLPQTVLRNFQESCIILATNREQLAIEITFRCLVADQEGRESGWKSSEYVNMMEDIKKAYDSNREVLKEDRSLFNYCYYFYARYYSKKTSNTAYPDLPEDDLPPLPENEAPNPLEKADEVLIPIERGHLNTYRASKVNRSDKKYEEYMNSAKSFHNQALSSAKELLGDHETTAICHKLLGDLHFSWKKHEESLTYYSDAIKLRKKLQLYSNEAFVFLLKNYGLCLSFCHRYEESVETLNEARGVADKLDERAACCRAKVYYALGRTFSSWEPDCQKAAKYAKVAMEKEELLDAREVKILKDVIKRAEEHMA